MPRMRRRGEVATGSLPSSGADDGSPVSSKAFELHLIHISELLAGTVALEEEGEEPFRRWLVSLFFLQLHAPRPPTLPSGHSVQLLSLPQGGLPVQQSRAFPLPHHRSRCLWILSALEQTPAPWLASAPLSFPAFTLLLISLPRCTTSLPPLQLLCTLRHPTPSLSSPPSPPGRLVASWSASFGRPSCSILHLNSPLGTPVSVSYPSRC